MPQTAWRRAWELASLISSHSQSLAKWWGTERGALFTQRQEGLYIQESLNEPLYCSLYNYTAS